MRRRPMKTLSKIVPLVTVLLLFSLNSKAQVLNTTPRNSWKDNWVIQFQPGISQFYGDATNHGYFQKFKGESALYGDLSARKMLIPALGVGLDFGYAGLKSYKDQKTDGTKVDLHLNGNYFDVSAFVYVDFNHLFAGYKPGRRFTLYGTVGLGWGFWNSSLTDGITGLVTQSGSTVGGYTFKNHGFVVPVGAGLNWKINDRWSVNLGGVLRTVFNDDVDVWHDGFKYDQIFSTNAGVTYRLHWGWGRSGKKQKALRQKKESCCNEKEKQFLSKPVIPIYDFDQIKPVVTAAAGSSVKHPAAIEPVPVQSVRKKTVPSQEFEFRVQILALSKPLKDVSTLEKKYHLPYAVTETHDGGLYRYTVGVFHHYSEALAASRTVQTHGITDAFVVAFRHGHRIPLTSEMRK
jgi:hypothetical protein